MKIHLSKKEKGQTLVMLVLGVVGLIALTGLAIDGGAAFADRRHAQNAADNAALSAALAMVQGNDLYQAAYAITSANGYTNDGVHDVVEVHNPPVSGPYAGNNEYVQVFITSHVPTTLGKIIGWNELVNHVEAVARGKPPQTAEMFDGHAVVSLAPHDCKAMTFQGNATLSVVNSGLFVNSDCSDAAFFNNSGAGNLAGPYLQSVGGVTYKAGAVTMTSGIQTGVTPYAYPPSWLPDTSEFCDASNTMSHLPGNVLAPGVYCLTNGLAIHNAGDSISGVGVTLVLLGGGLTWNGGNMNLAAPVTGPTAGLLIYVPMSNGSDVTLNGNATSNLVGSLLAPASNCTINGTSDATAFHSQFICYTTDLSGTGDTAIIYNDAENYDAVMPPEISIAQ